MWQYKEMVIILVISFAYLLWSQTYNVTGSAEACFKEEPRKIEQILDKSPYLSEKQIRSYLMQMEEVEITLDDITVLSLEE